MLQPREENQQEEGARLTRQCESLQSILQTLLLLPPAERFGVLHAAQSLCMRPMNPYEFGRVAMPLEPVPLVG